MFGLICKNREHPLWSNDQRHLELQISGIWAFCLAIPLKHDIFNAMTWIDFLILFGGLSIAVTLWRSRVSKRPRKPDVKPPSQHTRDLREALTKITLYGAMTPWWLTPFSILRHSKRKEWWQDGTQLPKARPTGPWDTEDTVDDDVVDIVPIDFDLRPNTGARKAQPPQDKNIP
ncbi:hypothetical protein DA792_07390 [Celeribacter baekdonensis]|uniref:Uncharacterized protein n=1 Tax=Celeribacter baekdonensis TaxID=875171 RepID=A0A2R4M1C0_9RHOB|nr:hypothetical protein DA792_07390 [Celeribacter baekdonensis]